MLKALRIFRQVCASFIQPDLALHVSHLLTQVEDLRTQYQAISVPHWIRTFHSLFSKLRGVTALLEANSFLDYSKTLKDLFHLDETSLLFQEAMMTKTLGRAQQQSQIGSSPPKKGGNFPTCFLPNKRKYRSPGSI